MKLILLLLAHLDLVVISTGKGNLDPKIYTFAFSNDGFPANYILNGQLVGQSIDMVNQVCHLAKRQCDTVFVPRKQCWDTKEFPSFSQVLNSRIFDVCANLPLSPERNFTYKFAKEAFLRAPFPLLIAPYNSDITVEDLKTCNNFTVAYPDNTAIEPDCILDLGLFIREENFVPVSARGDLVAYMHKIADLVVKKKIDMGIILPRFLRNRRDVKTIVELSCENEYKRGLNIMVRSDQKDILAWWQDALIKFMCVGESYRRFCKQLEKTYDIDPLCREPGKDLDCSKFGGEKAHDVRESRRIARIDPCVQKCTTQLLKNGQEFFEFLDDPEKNAVKALRGSHHRYKAEKEANLTFTVLSKNGRLFRVEKVCVTASSVARMVFTFKAFGTKFIKEFIADEKEHDRFSVCFDDIKGWHTEVNIFLQLVEPIVTRAGIRIRVSDLFMKTCAY